MAFVKFLKLSNGVLSQHSETLDDLKVNNFQTAGDVTVTGNLTVNGTTTTVNSSTLDVTDKNISVNVGGTDTTSEGAGLTVIRTGTSGSLIYAAASPTRFKIGDLGSEVDIADISSTQTLTNKTIDGLSNTLTNLNATNITSGTLSDARLSSNVSLLNTAQTHTALKTFSSGATIGTSLTLSASTTVDAGANKITNVADPTLAQDAATKNYVDTQIATSGDITEVIAGDGIAGGGTSGSVTVSVDLSTTSGLALIGTTPNKTLELADSVAGDGLSIASKILAVDSTVLRTNATQSVTSGTTTFATGTTLSLASGSTLSVSGTFNLQGTATTATGANLNTLTDGSNADALHSHSGVDALRLVKTFTAAVGGLSAGDAVYVSANDTVDKTNNSALSTSRFVGIAATAIAGSAQGTIITGGIATSVLTAATAGSPVYLDSVAGALTQTAPTTGILAEVGIAINGTDLLIQPKPPVTL